MRCSDNPSWRVGWVLTSPFDQDRVRISGAMGEPSDMAVIRDQSQIAIVVFGETEKVRGWHADVYVHRDGQWQAVWSQMTRIVD